MNALVVDNISKTFITKNKKKVHAISNTSFTINENEFVCILGPSGGGKSTLLNIIAGFEEPTSGQVIAHGQKINGPSPSRIMVFQEFALFPWLSVLDNISFGLEMKGMGRVKRYEHAKYYVALVGLEKFVDSYPSELSGGMKQRVAIARALAMQPDILLMDEPFGALDAYTRENLQQELLNIWEKERKTILFVTHSVDEAVTMADKIIIMAGSPGTIHNEISNTLDRKRVNTEPGFVELKAQIQKYVQRAGNLNASLKN